MYAVSHPRSNSEPGHSTCPNHSSNSAILPFLNACRITAVTDCKVLLSNGSCRAKYNNDRLRTRQFGKVPKDTDFRLDERVRIRILLLGQIVRSSGSGLGMCVHVVRLGSSSDAWSQQGRPEEDLEVCWFPKQYVVQVYIYAMSKVCPDQPEPGKDTHVHWISMLPRERDCNRFPYGPAL